MMSEAEGDLPYLPSYKEKWILALPDFHEISVHSNVYPTNPLDLERMRDLMETLGYVNIWYALDNKILEIDMVEVGYEKAS